MRSCSACPSVVMMVYLLLSGLFNPTSSMPEWVRWLAELNPVKHFVHVMRSVVVKGAGAAQLQMPILALTGFASALFMLAVRQYSKRSA